MTFDDYPILALDSQQLSLFNEKSVDVADESIDISNGLKLRTCAFKCGIRNVKNRQIPYHTVVAICVTPVLSETVRNPASQGTAICMEFPNVHPFIGYTMV